MKAMKAGCDMAESPLSKTLSMLIDIWRATQSSRLHRNMPENPFKCLLTCFFTESPWESVLWWKLLEILLSNRTHELDIPSPWVFVFVWIKWSTPSQLNSLLFPPILSANNRSEKLGVRMENMACLNATGFRGSKAIMRAAMWSQVFSVTKFDGHYKWFMLGDV